MVEREKENSHVSLSVKSLYIPLLPSSAWNICYIHNHFNNLFWHQILENGGQVHKSSFRYTWNIVYSLFQLYIVLTTWNYIKCNYTKNRKCQRKGIHDTLTTKLYNLKIYNQVIYFLLRIIIHWLYRRNYNLYMEYESNNLILQNQNSSMYWKVSQETKVE